jgi:hypothetical protein
MRSRLADHDSDVKAVALLRHAIVESSATRYNDGLRILMEAKSLFEASNSHALKGKFHMNLAIMLKNLGTAERREDYTDRALVEYAAASIHYEQAGHTRPRHCRKQLRIPATKAWQIRRSAPAP